MFRLVIAALAVVGLVSIFSNAAGGTVAATAGIVVLSVIAVKLAFIGLLFGFAGRKFRHRAGPHSWHGGRTQQQRRPAEERFEEWHRMAHAREEVDSWVEGFAPDEQE
ncbi:MAG: hypothetical protein R3246_13360 [Acidimicrobiia bacterium]|nr:hypothetical protein [Acidimicrobiia bacterium]